MLWGKTNSLEIVMKGKKLYFYTKVCFVDCSAFLSFFSQKDATVFAALAMLQKVQLKVHLKKNIWPSLGGGGLIHRLEEDFYLIDMI